MRRVMLIPRYVHQDQKLEHKLLQPLKNRSGSVRVTSFRTRQTSRNASFPMVKNWCIWLVSPLLALRLFADDTMRGGLFTGMYCISSAGT